MNPIESYRAPRSLDEAAEILRTGNVTVLAGGTDDGLWWWRRVGDTVERWWVLLPQALRGARRHSRLLLCASGVCLGIAFAIRYTQVLLAAGIAVLPPLLSGGGWAHWFYQSLVILVIAVLFMLLPTVNLVNVTVSRILEDVRRRGDRALVDYTRRFDCPAFGADDLRVVLRKKVTPGTVVKFVAEYTSYQTSSHAVLVNPKVMCFSVVAGASMLNST
mgnify:CR=1 FL=1